MYSRELVVVDYGDEFTKGQLEQKKEKTLALIKPDAFLKVGKVRRPRRAPLSLSLSLCPAFLGINLACWSQILNAIYKDGFRVGRMRSLHLSRGDAQEFYAEHRGKPFYDELTEFMSSGPIVALELISDGAIQKWRKLIGPTNTFKARDEAPSSLRAQFGTDGTRNACHGSDSPASADRELNFFFNQPGRFPVTARFNNCTLCVIKPHVVKAGVAGAIVDSIVEEGFEVSAAEMFNLTRVNAAEFLEVYKGVLPEYNLMVEEMSNGPCIALEVRSEHAVQAMREVMGPHDPELARVLRPQTIRSKHGLDKVMNAVHCTDLVEDGQLEVEYFFRILQM